ncbi:MAG: hypothetical protein ACYDBY_07845 [Thermoanaerobaculia bacterium]
MKRELLHDLLAGAAAFAAAFLLAGSALDAFAADSSAATPIGALLASRDLASAGETAKRPAIDGSQVNVLVYFRPDKDYSRQALAQLAPCVVRTAGKPVRWVGMVSASQSLVASLAAVKEAGLSMPVLLDEGDAYYVELGLAQLPAAAIFEKGRKLAAFQAFTKLNFCDHVSTQVRRALGELSGAEAKADLDPTPIPIKGDASVASRFVRKAQLLLRGGAKEKAVAAAREAVAADDSLAAAHAILGSCLAATGDCAGAAAAFDKALALDPADARALEGKKECAAANT